MQPWYQGYQRWRFCAPCPHFPLSFSMLFVVCKSQNSSAVFSVDPKEVHRREAEVENWFMWESETIFVCLATVYVCVCECVRGWQQGQRAEIPLTVWVCRGKMKIFLKLSVRQWSQDNYSFPPEITSIHTAAVSQPFRRFSSLFFFSFNEENSLPSCIFLLRLLSSYFIPALLPLLTLRRHFFPLPSLGLI